MSEYPNENTRHYLLLITAYTQLFEYKQYNNPLHINMCFTSYHL